MCIVTNEAPNDVSQRQTDTPATAMIGSFSNVDRTLFKETDVATLKTNFLTAFVTNEQLITDEIYTAIAHRSGATKEQLDQLKDKVSIIRLFKNLILVAIRCSNSNDCALLLGDNFKNTLRLHWMPSSSRMEISWQSTIGNYRNALPSCKGGVFSTSLVMSTSRLQCRCLPWRMVLPPCRILLGELKPSE